MGFEPRESAPLNNLQCLRNSQSSRITQNLPSWNDPGTVNTRCRTRGSERPLEMHPSRRCTWPSLRRGCAPETEPPWEQTDHGDGAQRGAGLPRDRSILRCHHARARTKFHAAGRSRTCARRWRPRPRVRRIQLPGRPTTPNWARCRSRSARSTCRAGVVLLIAGAGLLVARRSVSWHVRNGTSHPLLTG